MPPQPPAVGVVVVNEIRIGIEKTVNDFGSDFRVRAAAVEHQPKKRFGTRPRGLPLDEVVELFPDRHPPLRRPFAIPSHSKTRPRTLHLALNFKPPKCLAGGF